MQKGHNKSRFLCDDTKRAALNRKIVKQKLYVEAYPTDEELKARGVPIQAHTKE